MRRLLWASTAAVCLQPCVAIMDPNAEEMRLAWKYPTCMHLRQQGMRRVDWPTFRERLHARPYPDNLPLVWEVLGNMSGRSSEYDEEARLCLMGIPTAYYYLTRHSLDNLERDEEGRPETGAARKVILQYSVVENYLSALDPGMISRANWTVTNRQVVELRGQIFRLYRQLEAQELKSAPTAGRSESSTVRVYVYTEEEVPELRPLLQSQLYCSRGQWGTDVQIHDFFTTSTCRTDEPKEADFFFVPGYGICVLESNLLSLDEIDAVYRDVVRALPYFNASGGRDHVFSFGSGMAHSVFQSWKEYIPRSIVLTPETELFNDFAWVAVPPFDTWRDIAIPGSLDLAEVIGLTEASRPLAQRTRLAAFFGRADKVRGPHPWVGGVDVRREVLQLRHLPGAEAELDFGEGAQHSVMHAAYGNARFCFVPRGKSGWSLRLYEVLFAGCVPVILSDSWELPFEDFLDVTRFAIKWPSTQIGAGLLEYLRSLPDAVVQGYMDEAKRIRCWYFYPPRRWDIRASLRRSHGVCPEEQGQDALQGILRLLWKKRRMSRTAFTSFFFPDSTGRVLQTDADLKPWR